MFVDASAIVAVLNMEPGHEELLQRLATRRRDLFVSPLVRFEATAAIARSRSGARRPTPVQFKLAADIVEQFCDELKARDINITHAVGSRATAAGAKYGKFVGHKADLNFGDCFAYACAAVYGVDLLYVGEDFKHTDLG